MSETGVATVLSASDEANLFSSLSLAMEHYSEAGMRREHLLVERAAAALRLHLRQREAALGDASVREKLARARDVLSKLGMLPGAAQGTLAEVLALASTAEGWAHVAPAAEELRRYLTVFVEVQALLEGVLHV